MIQAIVQKFCGAKLGERKAIKILFVKKSG